MSESVLPIEPLGVLPKVSVCMAAYNGSKHIEQMVDSILAQLGPNDEIVVVDDSSKDDTVKVLQQIGDPRIRIIEQKPNRGYAQTFGRALTEARGQYLFFADQDDVWQPGRVAAMVAALDDGAEVVATNLSILDGPDRVWGPYPRQQDWHLRAKGSRRRLRNLAGIVIGGMSYWGCAMAVKRDALQYLLPFPEFLTESHDLYRDLRQLSAQNEASRDQINLVA